MNEQRCPAITAKGAPCEGYVHPGRTYCPSHDPARAEARKQAASKAGRVRTHTEFKEVKEQLRRLADEVLAGDVSRADAAVVSQILGVWAKVAEAEVRLRQFEEIEKPEFEQVLERIETLEEQYSARGGEWGA